MLVVAATERELALLDGLDTSLRDRAGRGGAADLRARSRSAGRSRCPHRARRLADARATGARPGQRGRLLRRDRSGVDLPRIERPARCGSARPRPCGSPRGARAPVATCGKVGAGTDFDVEAMEGLGVLLSRELAGVPAVRAARDSQLASGRSQELALRRRVRRAGRRATATRRPLGNSALPWRGRGAVDEDEDLLVALVAHLERRARMHDHHSARLDVHPLPGARRAAS